MWTHQRERRTGSRGAGGSRGATGSAAAGARRTNALPPAVGRRVNAAVAGLAALGLTPAGTVALEVAGRRTGRIRRTAVVLVHYGGRGYLVSLGGEAQWVRNVRAAEGRAVIRHGRRRPLRLTEVPVAERAPILHAFLSQRALTRSAARSARYYFGLPPHPSVGRLAPLAARYPVFETHYDEPGQAMAGVAADVAVRAVTVARDARRALREGPDGIAARRQRRLTATVEHARRHSPFYAEHYAGLPTGPVELHRLPPVTKRELMARFDAWTTDREVTRAAVEAFVARVDTIGTDFLGRYVVFSTSGSTGEPALLVQDRHAVAVMTGLAYARSAGVLPARSLLRVLARGARQAAIFATDGHFLAATMFARRQRAHPFRRHLARMFSVLEPLPRLVAELNAFRPVLVSSYASALTILADEQRAGRLRISPVVVTSGGEGLLPADRRRIESAFGCRVTESYNASEVPMLSLTCRLGRLHLNTDWFVVEPVDEAGAPVPPGTLSHTVLVTNLANRVQPIIRYDLGDSVLVRPDPCPCGSPLPTVEVEGRTDETLLVARPPAQPVALLPMALATVVEETPGVHRFQIVQTAPGTLRVRLETGAGADRVQVWGAVRDRLRAHLAAAELPDVVLELAHDAPAADPRSGKLRHVRAETPPLR